MRTGSNDHYNDPPNPMPKGFVAFAVEGTGRMGDRITRWILVRPEHIVSIEPIDTSSTWSPSLVSLASGVQIQVPLSERQIAESIALLEDEGGEDRE